MDWQLRTRHMIMTRPLVMGIVNVTPDSFSDGGRFLATDAAVRHGLRLRDEGADVLDVGGESTRPGATPVLVDEELRRVVPLVTELAAKAGVPVSIDTMKAKVAAACADAGAEIVNDVSGLRDSAMVEVVARSGVAAIVMHMRGTPADMQDDPQYDDVVAAVDAFFEERLRTLATFSIDPERIVLDPGIGFGKRSGHNWELIAALPRFQRLGRPVCLGVSRKGFLGKDRPPTERLAAGLAVACHGVTTGGVQIIRTHDVKATRDAVDALEHIRNGC